MGWLPLTPNEDGLLPTSAAQDESLSRTIMQVTLAAVCLLSSIAVWLAGATFWWVVAGVLQVSVFPFTLLVILPTNKQSLSPTLDRRSAQTERLLARWGVLHAVRSALSALALLLLLYLLIFAKS